MMSAFTAFLVEGDINQALRRRSLQKRIEKLTDRYIICGIGHVGANVAHALSVTNREYVIIDTDQHKNDVPRCTSPGNRARMPAA